MKYSNAMAIGFLIVYLLAAPPAGRAAEYFTELEIDQIREAQDIGRRVPLLLQIAEIRLARLGLIQEEEEIEGENPGGNAFSRTLIRILSPAAASELERISEEQPEFDNDLEQFSRADLLLGYYQALEETMDNIDDAYERKRGNVRKPLEALKEFTETTIPLLREFEPETDSELDALEDAMEQAELALEGALSALEIVPKTEEK